MGNGFGKNGMGKRNDRDRLLFIAAAGLAFSLLVIMLVVLNYQSDVSAKDSGLSGSTASMPNLGSVKIWVADRPVKLGEKLSDVPFHEVSWPRNTVPAGAIIDRAEAKDMYAKMALAANMPIERANLTNQPIQETLPVTPGNRAVTVDVDATSGVEGLALPGTQVDIILTSMEEKNLVSRVIVQNARVLAAGGDTKTLSERGALDRQGGTVGNAAIRTVTLDVSTKDALKINTARQIGKLNLMMRGSGGTEIIPDTSFSSIEFSGGDPSKKGKTAKCTNGRVRISGQEMQLNCDGTMTTIESSSVR